MSFSQFKVGLKREKVDICAKPDTIIHAAKANLFCQQEITVGDLHANALKLIFILIKHGYTELSEDDYEGLSDLYMSYFPKEQDYFFPVPDATEEEEKAKLKNDLVIFEKILGNIKFKKKYGQLLRFLGDELFDRGANDFFILKILEKLTDNEIFFEIILSNHGLEFIRSYEEATVFNPLRLNYGQQTSADNLQKLIDLQIVSRDSIITLINKAFKPHLKALSYTIPPPPQSGIIIHTHAPCEDDQLFVLIDSLVATLKATFTKLEIKDTEMEGFIKNLMSKHATPLELAKTIDEINKGFNWFVKNNQVCKLMEFINVDKSTLINIQDNPFFYLAWNRQHSQSIVQDRPYPVNYTHGHDTLHGHLNVMPVKNVIDLNNMLGIGGGNFNKGEYNYFFSDARPYDYALKISNKLKTGINLFDRSSFKTALKTFNKQFTIDFDWATPKGKSLLAIAGETEKLIDKFNSIDNKTNGNEVKRKDLRLRAIDHYEQNCKKIFDQDKQAKRTAGKAVASIVFTAACVALGAVSFALMYGAAFSWSGPGGIVAAVVGLVHGGIVGYAAGTVGVAGALAAMVGSNYLIFKKRPLRETDETSAVCNIVKEARASSLNNSSANQIIIPAMQK